MVIHKLHVMNVTFAPAKTNSKLIVDANNPLASPFTFELFKAIPGRFFKVSIVVAAQILSRQKPALRPPRQRWKTLCTEARVRFLEIVRLPLILAIVCAGCLLTACAAEPTAEDVTRVKEQFLVLRFQAPLVAELRHLSDRDLFERSCKNHRVRCDAVLEMLKKDEPDFYNTLMK